MGGYVFKVLRIKSELLQFYLLNPTLLMVS